MISTLFWVNRKKLKIAETRTVAGKRATIYKPLSHARYVKYVI